MTTRDISSVRTLATAKADQAPSTELLTLPDHVLEHITSQLDIWEAVYLAQTCHKLHKLFNSMQPPMTVLDSSILRPSFSVELEGSVPLVHIFHFKWDEWADGMMQKMLLRKQRASISIGKGLAKHFCAWTKTQEAKTWQAVRTFQHSLLNFLQDGGDIGFETCFEPSDKPVEEFIECQLSIPNMHWDTDSRRLQKHFTAVMQPLVEALTSFVKDMQPVVPHVSISISNYDDAAFWPKYSDPPPWTCHSQLETLCTCGDPKADCAIKQRLGSDYYSSEEDTSKSQDADFMSQSDPEDPGWNCDVDSD